jgi:hypothetical protein
MNNMNLNAGGVICALLFGIGTGVILFTLDFEPDRIGKISLCALVAGAFAGNFAWERIFPSSRDRKNEPAGGPPDRPADRTEPVDDARR